MANLIRKNQKIFAMAGGQIGQFGSAQALSPLLSNDLDIIQDRAAYDNGWFDSVISGNKRPPIEELNGVNFVSSYQIGYILQKGIPEWQSQTEYYIGDLTREVGGTKLYQSITDNNIGNVLTDIVNWELLGDLADLKSIPSHISDIANPHSVTASQVGNTVAQWNADKLQDKDISPDVPTEGQMLVYRSSSDSWEVETTSLGFMGFVDNVVVTPIASIDTPVLVNQPTYLPFELIGFDQPVNSRLRYIGTEPRRFKISVNVCLFASSNDRLMTIYLGLNGSIINNSKSSNTTTGGECTETSIDFVQTLSNNEYLEIFVENNENADDITCTQIRIIANEIK